MKLEIPLLILLAARRMSGYDIKQWVEVEGKFIGLDRHSSQIYRELNKMQVEGWLVHDVDPREGTPDAKVYRLTPDGMARLRRWSSSAYVPSRRFQDPEFTFRLRCAAMLDRSRVGALVQEELHAREQQRWLNRGRPRPQDHLTTAGAHPEIDVEALALVADEANRAGEQALDAWIDWLQHLLRTLPADLLGETSPTPSPEQGGTGR
ncbi:PadR family transcriptional regulator [Kineococcus sp. LSe6-4]|uniref:PadR family transcriptional regulator n=1 Tax=Kineococcus halophytocola TaxID=3234027 RepID=A0ABV4H5U8_9ACTN